MLDEFRSKTIWCEHLAKSGLIWIWAFTFLQKKLNTAFLQYVICLNWWGLVPEIETKTKVLYYVICITRTIYYSNVAQSAHLFFFNGVHWGLRRKNVPYIIAKILSNIILELLKLTNSKVVKSFIDIFKHISEVST